MSVSKPYERSEETQAFLSNDNESIADEPTQFDGKLPLKRTAWIRFLLFIRELPCLYRHPHTDTSPSISWSQQFLSFFLFLIPSYISMLPVFRKESIHTTAEKRLRPTAYLDGLRGWAALVVYIYHFTLQWFPRLAMDYNGEQSLHLIWQRSIIRLIHSGRASVIVFFIISGYVITLKPLSTIYQGQRERVLDALAGSVFRRPFRLFLPIIAAAIMSLVMLEANIFIAGPRKETFALQTWHWIKEFMETMDPYQVVHGRNPYFLNFYINALWTIPVEFRGSMMCFLLLIAFSGTKRSLHLTAVCINIIWLIARKQMDLALFCVGLFLAELSIILPPVTSGQRISKLWWWLGQLLTILTCILSLHLLSFPYFTVSENSEFWWLKTWTPSPYTDIDSDYSWFWMSIGAIILIPTLMYSPPTAVSWKRLIRRGKKDERLPSHERPSSDIALNAMQTDNETSTNTAEDDEDAEPLLQKPFTTSFAQYLGWISYSIYLIHQPFLNSIAIRWLEPASNQYNIQSFNALTAYGKGDMDQYHRLIGVRENEYLMSAAGAFLSSTFVIFWVSDIFTRAVDVPTIHFTRWIWNYTKAI